MDRYFCKYNWDFILLFWFFLRYQNTEHQKALLLSKQAWSYMFELGSELLGWNSVFFSIVSSTKGICTCSVYKNVNRNKVIIITLIELINQMRVNVLTKRWKKLPTDTWTKHCLHAMHYYVLLVITQFHLEYFILCPYAPSKLWIPFERD